MKTGALMLAIIGLGVCFSHCALADAKGDAKRHFETGLTLLKLEDFTAAALSFETAVQIFPSKGGLYNLANCYKSLKRYKDALAALNRLKQEFGPSLDASMRKAVEEQIAVLLQVVALVAISVDKNDAAISVDGQWQGQSPLASAVVLDPGEHLISVSLNGYEIQERTVRVASQTQSDFHFALVAKGELSAQPPVVDPVPPVSDAKSPSSTENQTPSDEAEAVVAPETAAGNPKDTATSDGRKNVLKPLTWVAFGIGAAAGITTIVTGALTLKKSKNLQDDCGGTTCSSDHQKDWDKAHTLGVVTNVMLGVTIAGVAAGTVLLIVDKRNHKEKALALSPVVTPQMGGLMMAGRF